MIKKEIQLLYEYDKWADGKLLEVIATLSADNYKKDLGSSFGGIHGTFVHILSANLVWLDRWRGKTPLPLKVDELPSVEAVKKHWDTYGLEIKNFLLALTDETLNESLIYVDFKGNNFANLLYQLMQHKVNHSTYHRGQIVTMLRQLNVGAVSTDLITYIRQKEISD